MREPTAEMNDTQTQKSRNFKYVRKPKYRKQNMQNTFRSEKNVWVLFEKMQNRVTILEQIM